MVGAVLSADAFTFSSLFFYCFFVIVLGSSINKKVKKKDESALLVCAPMGTQSFRKKPLTTAVANGTAAPCCILLLHAPQLNVPKSAIWRGPIDEYAYFPFSAATPLSYRRACLTARAYGRSRKSPTLPSSPPTSPRPLVCGCRTHDGGRDPADWSLKYQRRSCNDGAANYSNRE